MTDGATPTFEEAVEVAADMGYRVWMLKQGTKGEWRASLYLVPGRQHHENDIGQTGLTEQAQGRNAAEAILCALDAMSFTAKLTGPFGTAPYGGEGSPIGYVTTPPSTSEQVALRRTLEEAGDLEGLMKHKFITTYDLSIWTQRRKQITVALNDTTERRK